MAPTQPPHRPRNRAFSSKRFVGKSCVKDKAPASSTGIVAFSTTLLPVERFTFMPNSTETDLPNPPPKLRSWYFLADIKRAIVHTNVL